MFLSVGAEISLDRIEELTRDVTALKNMMRRIEAMEVGTKDREKGNG